MRNSPGLRRFQVSIALGVLCVSSALVPAMADGPRGILGGNRLLATGGVMQIEGSAGGGAVPWALITGLGTDAQIGGSGFCTEARVQRFDLASWGVAAGFHDRVEVAFARQTFDLDEIIPGESIDVDVIGAKVRLFGDAVFDQD